MSDSFYYEGGVHIFMEDIELEGNDNKCLHDILCDKFGERNTIYNPLGKLRIIVERVR